MGFNPLLGNDDQVNFAPTASLAVVMNSPASHRSVIESWAEGFVDRDKKFVKEFQTRFNPCFWELYIFACLKELELAADFAHTSPDFVVADGFCPC